MFDFQTFDNFRKCRSRDSKKLSKLQLGWFEPFSIFQTPLLFLELLPLCPWVSEGFLQGKREEARILLQHYLRWPLFVLCGVALSIKKLLQLRTSCRRTRWPVQRTQLMLLSIRGSWLACLILTDLYLMTAVITVQRNQHVILLIIEWMVVEPRTKA